MTSPPDRRLPSQIVVSHDGMGQADGEPAALTHVDERLDAGGEDGLGAVDAPAAYGQFLGSCANWRTFLVAPSHALP